MFVLGPSPAERQADPPVCWQVFQESICHCLQKYCLNYSAALLYLDNLKLREDFGIYVKVQETNHWRGLDCAESQLLESRRRHCCAKCQRAHGLTDLSAMRGPERGTWPFLPLVTFPVSMPYLLVRELIVFWFQISLPVAAHPPPSPWCPTTLPPLWPSVCSSQLLSLGFPQWCERNELCRRLQLRDLLVAPLQRLTRYPLLLRNMAKRCQMEDENKGLQTIAEQVDTSICELTTAELTPVITKPTVKSAGTVTLAHSASVCMCDCPFNSCWQAEHSLVPSISGWQAIFFSRACLQHTGVG